MYRVTSQINVIKRSRSGMFVENTEIASTPACHTSHMSHTSSSEDLIFDVDLDSIGGNTMQTSLTSESALKKNDVIILPNSVTIEGLCPRDKLRDIYQRRKEACVYANRQRIVFAPFYIKSHHHPNHYNHKRVIGFDIKHET